MTTSGGGWVGWGGSLPYFAKKKINSYTSSCACIYKCAGGRVEVIPPTHPTHPRDARRCQFAAFKAEARV